MFKGWTSQQIDKDNLNTFFKARDPNIGTHLKFLLIDDRYQANIQLDEEDPFSRHQQLDSIDIYCQFLADKDGESLTHPASVSLHLVSDFDFAKSAILSDVDDPRCDYDGIFLDLMDDNTGEIKGVELFHLTRKTVKPRIPILVMSQNKQALHGFEDDYCVNRPEMWALEKKSYKNRNNSEFLILQKFFSYAGKRRVFLDKEWAEEYQSFIGSETRDKVLELLEIIQERDPEKKLPILILGETGTGKELVARLIHGIECWGNEEVNDFLLDKIKDKNKTHDFYNSDKKNLKSIESKEDWFLNFQSFLAQGQGSEIIQSALFGHVRNAFNNAEERNGMIALAEKGTLFIDEVGDLPPEIQTSLLRYLQEGEIQKVGGNTKIKVPGVRNVFATHKFFNEEQLEQLIENEEVRKDFLYRLDSGLTIVLPSLQERTNEHEELIDYFITESGFLSRPGNTLNIENVLETDVRNKILEHCRSGDFSGNIRHLKAFIARLMLLTDTNKRVSMEEYQKAFDYSLMKPGAKKKL